LSSGGFGNRHHNYVSRPHIVSNRLPVQVAIIVPSTKNNKNISTSSFSRRVDSEKKYFDSKFGGDTAVKDVGSYVQETKRGKKLIKERGVIVESSTTPKIYEKNKKDFESHVVKRQKQWKQDTILFRVEGEDFIYPKRPYIAHAGKKGNIRVD
jgi:hypothetical protein